MISFWGEARTTGEKGFMHEGEKGRYGGGNPTKQRRCRETVNTNQIDVGASRRGAQYLKGNDGFNGRAKKILRGTWESEEKCSIMKNKNNGRESTALSRRLRTGKA